MPQRKAAVAIGLVALVVIGGLAITPVSAQESSLSISNVAVPNSVAQGDSFGISISVSATGLNSVQASVSPPNGIACSPSGTQSVTLSDGEGSVTFDCQAESTGDFSGEIGVDVSGKTSTGSTRSASQQTGIRVLSPAALTVSPSLSNTTTNPDSTESLTLIIHNTGDIRMGYSATVTAPDAVSLSKTAGSTDGDLSGSGIETLEYQITPNETGTQTLDIRVTGENGQTLSESVDLSVESQQSNQQERSGGSSSSGDGDTSSSDSSDSDEGDGENTAEDSSGSGEGVPEVTSDVVEAKFDGTGPVSGVRIAFDSEIGGDVTFTPVSTPPQAAPDLPKQFITGIEVSVPNNASGRIQLNLSAETLDEQHIAPDSLQLYHYNASSATWGKIPTIRTTTANQTRLDGNVSSFSLIGVFGTQQTDSTQTTTAHPTTKSTATSHTTTSSTTAQTTQQTTETLSTTSVTTTSTGTTATATPGFGFIPVLGTLIGVGLIRRSGR